MLPDGKPRPAHVSTIVELPLSLAVGSTGAERRAQRRAGDALIALTGGRAVLPEELRGTSDAEVAEGLRALGEDPAQALTFSIVVSRRLRQMAAASPIPGFRTTHRTMADFSARREVRAAGSLPSSSPRRSC